MPNDFKDPGTGKGLHWKQPNIELLSTGKSVTSFVAQESRSDEPLQCGMRGKWRQDQAPFSEQQQDVQVGATVLQKDPKIVY